MKIKVVNCFDPEAWYSDKIGRQYKVENYNDEYYKALSVKTYLKLYNKKKKVPFVNPNWTFLIKKNDCEVING